MSKKINNENLSNVSGGIIEEVSVNGDPIGEGGVYEGKFNIFDEHSGPADPNVHRIYPLISVDYHDEEGRREAYDYAQRIDRMLNGDLHR